MLTAAIAAAKMSFDTFAMISFSASDTRKIGWHRRKFHHTFLSNMQSRIVPLHAKAVADRGEYRRAAGFASLKLVLIAIWFLCQSFPFSPDRFRRAGKFVIRLDRNTAHAPAKGRPRIPSPAEKAPALDWGRASEAIP